MLTAFDGAGDGLAHLYLAGAQLPAGELADDRLQCRPRSRLSRWLDRADSVPLHMSTVATRHVGIVVSVLLAAVACTARADERAAVVELEPSSTTVATVARATPSAPRTTATTATTTA